MKGKPYVPGSAEGGGDGGKEGGDNGRSKNISRKIGQGQKKRGTENAEEGEKGGESSNRTEQFRAENVQESADGYHPLAPSRQLHAQGEKNSIAQKQAWYL